MRSIVPLGAMAMRGVTAAQVEDVLPQLVFVAPSEIFVESEYQRDLSVKSIAMIRKMIAGWRWAHVKPVICARVGSKLMAIDGQHTAIAARSLGIEKIPAMVVIVGSVKERAEAFIGQNCDRLNLTPAHIHYASLAAGEEMAVAVDQACRRAGVSILKASKGAGATYKIGETFAVGFIKGMVKRYGVNFAVRVLRVLIDAKRAPINAVEIAAVQMLLRDKSYAGKVDGFDLTTVIRSASVQEHLVEAQKFVADGEPRRSALAKVFFAGLGKKRAA